MWYNYLSQVATDSQHNFEQELVLLIFFKKMGQPRPLFRLFSVFFKQTSLQFLQQIYEEKMSIQYTVPGFEPTTFGT